MDWFDLFAVLRTLKSLLQHHNLKGPQPSLVPKVYLKKAECLLYSPALTSYITTGRTIALNIQTFVSKVLALLFDTRSRFVIA